MKHRGRRLKPSVSLYVFVKDVKYLRLFMLKKLFGFNPIEHNVRTEVMAGITTFLTMAYILAVNPNILGETGMDKGALFTTTVLMAALPTITLNSRWHLLQVWDLMLSLHIPSVP